MIIKDIIMKMEIKQMNIFILKMKKITNYQIMIKKYIEMIHLT